MMLLQIRNRKLILVSFIHVGKLLDLVEFPGGVFPQPLKLAWIRLDQAMTIEGRLVLFAAENS